MDILNPKCYNFVDHQSQRDENQPYRWRWFCFSVDLLLFHNPINKVSSLSIEFCKHEDASLSYECVVGASRNVQLLTMAPIWCSLTFSNIFSNCRLGDKRPDCFRSLINSAKFKFLHKFETPSLFYCIFRRNQMCVLIDTRSSSSGLYNPTFNHFQRFHIPCSIPCLIWPCCSKPEYTEQMYFAKSFLYDSNWISLS